MTERAKVSAAMNLLTVHIVQATPWARLRRPERPNRFRRTVRRLRKGRPWKDKHLRYVQMPKLPIG